MTIELKDLHNQLITVVWSVRFSLQPVGSSCKGRDLTVIISMPLTLMRLVVSWVICKEEKFYALTGGDRIDILDKDRQPLKTREDA